MTEPKGAVETVRIWYIEGRFAATIQAQEYPPVAFADASKRGESLVLGTTRFENGKPLKASVTLSVEGDTMTLTEELEGSPVIRRGAGKQGSK
jgi:hypothetical protein